MPDKRYVIVGNSAAALSALEAIRRVDKTGSITLVSDEDRPAYSRVLTPYVISGELEDASIRDNDYYRRMGVETVFGRRADTIEDGHLILDNGKSLSYERLLIATGSSAARPGITGIDSSGVFSLKNLADADAIRARALESKRALIIGGGLICLLVVRALIKLGLQLSLAVLSGRILSRMLDEEGSRIVQDHLEARGIRISTGVDVVEITEEADGSLTAVSTEGNRYTADLMIIAKGIRSNIDLARNGGIKTSRGVLVDQYMRTSEPNVFAAGDVAESKDLLIRGKRTICATWFEAIHQGEIAGYNMAGLKRPTFGSLKMNVMETADVPVASVGVYDAEDREYEVVTRSEDAYRKFVIRKDRIIGAILVGDVSDSGIVASLIRRGMKLSTLPRVDLRRPLNYPSLMRV
jgi:NAD(P)H-nitrite reductase large subunit